ncbi:MAG: VanW family protein [Planctomycetes bacterium]|jgi:vancomycin resistance protein YoaR|nr:VanW family protein [Planctomycetota bacterium]
MIKLKIKKVFAFPRWLLAIVIIFFIVSALAAAGYFIFEQAYREKIYPNVKIGGYAVGGLTPAQALNMLNKKVDRLNQNGVIFSYGDHRFALLPMVASVEGDLAYQLFSYDTEKTVNSAFAYGRQSSFAVDLDRKFRLLLRSYNQPLSVKLNSAEVKKILMDNFLPYAVPAVDAALAYAAPTYGADYKFTVTKEKLGQTFDYERAVAQLERQLAAADASPIMFKVSDDYPEIYEKDCLNIPIKASRLFALSPLTLAVGAKAWAVKKIEFVDWLKLELNNQPGTEDKVLVSLDEEKIGPYLKDKISTAINQPPVDAKFEIKDGKVLEFQASRDGIELNVPASVAQIKNNVIRSASSTVELVTRQLKSMIVMEKINDLGIKQLIGTGESNFYGSPKNRRHNIKVGADTLNGLLIKPAEEFSLNQALGEIDKSTGYLPELVIKDNKTIPEYGGGLCQIGTTMFRAALGAGLPITMRRNHSYRVSYYEPAGTDATIYSPWPDLKFINDTPNHILIQARIEGDNLYFDLWGTQDGRTATRTDPVIYNIVKPGPTKIIETLDLPPGEKKCTEKPHNGADTYFDYTVKYSPANPPAELRGKDNIAAENLVIETRFKSHYVPWREVCLLGVAELSENKTATSTEAAAENNQGNQ